MSQDRKKSLGEETRSDISGWHPCPAKGWRKRWLRKVARLFRKRQDRKDRKAEHG